MEYATKSVSIIRFASSASTQMENQFQIQLDRTCKSNTSKTFVVTWLENETSYI